MKEMNNAIRRNEGQLNKNQHKIKKLDGVYKSSVMKDLKQETSTLWGYFNSHYADLSVSYPNSTDSPTQPEKVPPKQPTKKPVDTNDEEAKQKAAQGRNC